MLAITFCVGILLVFLISKNIYVFLTKIYKTPLIVNTYAEFIPSLYIKDGMIHNRNNTYSVIIKITGYKYFKSTDLLKSINTTYLIKKRALNMTYLEENIQIKFLFKRKKSLTGYQNNNYIEITGHNIKEIQNTVNILIGNLNEYNLKWIQGQDLQEFLFENANLVPKKISNIYNEKAKNKVNLSDVCSYSQIVTDESKGVAYIENLDIKKHFTALSVSFGAEIELQYFFELIRQDLEFDYVFNGKFLSNIAAKNLIATELKNVALSESSTKDSVSDLKKREIWQTKQHILNQEETLIVADIFLILYADTEEELNNKIKIIQNLSSKYEMFLTRETYLMLFFFMQRLTGFRLQEVNKFLLPFSDITAYSRKILSSTMAGSFDYIDTPKGLNKCDWGEKPICTFNTSYNNTYSFYTHVSEQKTEVGHGVVIAPTGAGKTTFVQYLMKGILSSYEDVDIYSFDRYNGMKIFTYWREGQNIEFEKCQINPFQIDLTKSENLDFITIFLHILCNKETEEISNQISILVKTLAEIPIEKRVLKLLKEQNILHEEMVALLFDWIEGKYAHYINASEDTFNLNSRLLNFQMDKILEDETLSAPMIYYIMFKIREKAQKEARGHFVFIDEAASMVKNSYFQKQISIFLNEHRKLRGCIWLAFQNPTTFLDNKDLKQLILSQCQNQIIFTSNSLNQEILNNLSIDKNIYNELERAQQDNKDKYYILLKRPNENVIININLIKLGEDITLYSSATEDINRVEQLRKNSMNTWVNDYLSLNKKEQTEIIEEIEEDEYEEQE